MEDEQTSKRLSFTTAMKNRERVVADHVHGFGSANQTRAMVVASACQSLDVLTLLD